VIAGAGLDVFENEPAVEPALLKMENVVLLPHIASASLQTRTRMAMMASENIVAHASGKRPPNILNPVSVPSSGSRKKANASAPNRESISYPKRPSENALG
jgi:phosphoglycerate dehydrogenase-like enzyme